MTNFKQSLKVLKEIAKQVEQDDHSFNHELHNFIYHKLIYQNVPKEDLNVDLSDEGVFKAWCRNKRERTNAFISPSNPYMCQFISRDTKALGKSEHFKAYLPLDRVHVEKGVNDIIEFLDNSRIPHHTKVGRKIGLNGVVVNLVSEDDLLRLLTFVKNSDYIQEGLLKPNSFAYTDNGVALACDGSISYIDVLTSYILLYMKRLKECNELDNVSVQGLYKFIINYYATTFVEERDPSRPHILKKFQADFYPANNKVVDVNDPTVIDDYHFVTKLIIESQAKDYTMDLFIKHLGVLRNKKLVDRSINFEEVDNILRGLIETIIRKNDSNYRTWNIEKYLETGESVYLTNYDDCRRRVSNTTFREDMLYMLDRKKISIHDYVSAFYDRMFVLDDDIVDLIKEFLSYGEKKYGKEDVKEYLKGYITTENAAFITNDNDFRSRFKDLRVADRVKLFMKSTGKNIDYVIELSTPKIK